MTAHGEHQVTTGHDAPQPGTSHAEQHQSHGHGAPHPTTGHGEHHARHAAKYRDIVPALTLLSVVTFVMLTLTAVRVGVITVEVKLGPRLTSAQSSAPVAAPAAPAPRRRFIAPKSSPLAVATAEASVRPETPAPVRVTSPVAPSKALASASAPSKPECATPPSTLVNVDPTAGDIAGTTGLPDQVSYFKHRSSSSACRSARTAAR